MKKELQVGDVFTCPNLAKCQYQESPQYKKYLIPGDGDANDAARATREFVVVDTAFTGGDSGGGMNGHDDYPDGWRVIAKELKPDGSFSAEGIPLLFYQSGCFSNMIYPKDVTKDRTMCMWFLRDDEKVVKA